MSVTVPVRVMTFKCVPKMWCQMINKRKDSIGKKRIALLRETSPSSADMYHHTLRATVHVNGKV